MKVDRPVLRWHGGKFLLAPWILAHIPKHTVYAEPFGGAASVLLRKPPVAAEVYNDLDDVVVNVFRVLRDHDKAAELRHRLGLTPYARAEFEWCYEPAVDDIDRAHKAIVLSFFGFGSDSVSRGCRTGFRAKMSDGRATPAQTWADYADTIPAFVNRMRGVVIESRPASEILERYDTPETAFYVDPPYPHSTRSSLNGRSSKTHGYRHELDDDDHAALLDQLKSLCGMVVLSGYPFQPYDDALEGWLRVERSALADGAKERTEVLWINPRAAERLDTRNAQGSFFA